MLYYCIITREVIMKVKRFTIDMPEDLHEDIKTMAFFNKTTMKDIVVEKLREVVAEYKKRDKQNEKNKE
jgi:hypothetical protein